MVAERIPRGIRARTTAVAVVVAAVSLLIAAVGLTWVLENNLRDNLDSTVETQARARGELLDAGADPATLVDSAAAVYLASPTEAGAMTGCALPVGAGRTI